MPLITPTLLSWIGPFNLLVQDRGPNLLGRFRRFDGDVHPRGVSSEKGDRFPGKPRIDSIVVTVVDFAFKGCQTGNIRDERIGVMTIAHDHRVKDLG